MRLKFNLGVVGLLVACVEGVIYGVVMVPHLRGTGAHQGVHIASKSHRVLSFTLRPGDVLLGELYPRSRHRYAIVIKG